MTRQSKSPRAGYKGLVKEDPIEHLEIGGSLHFQPVPFQVHTELSDVSVANWEAFRGTLLTVSFVRGAKLEILGSAIIVAPGIALCATHVIAGEIESLTGGTVAAYCNGAIENSLMIWKVRKLTVVPNSDTTILCISLNSDMPPDSKFYLPIMTTRCPQPGEHLTLCGYVAAAQSFEINSENGRKEAGCELRTSRGEVTKTYLSGRDSAMLPWPVIEVSCRARGGMSGGPVFDSRGALVGLTCSSFDLEDGSGISYVSMLYPAYTCRTEHCWPKGFIKDRRSLIELDRRVCAIEEPSAIAVTYDESTGESSTEVRIWH